MNNEIIFLSTKGAEKNSRDPNGTSQGSDFNDFFDKEVESQRKADRTHGVEQIGKELRRLMSWIDEKEV